MFLETAAGRRDIDDSKIRDIFEFHESGRFGVSGIEG